MAIFTYGMQVEWLINPLCMLVHLCPVDVLWKKCMIGWSLMKTSWLLFGVSYNDNVITWHSCLRTSLVPAVMCDVLWPPYQSGLCSDVLCRFPHPVTFGGMLEMSVAYLPVNKNWQLYIDRSQAKYDQLQRQLSSMLTRLANEAANMSADRCPFVCVFSSTSRSWPNKTGKLVGK